MVISLRSDHTINGMVFPRGTNDVVDEALARALLSADRKATPEESFRIDLVAKKPKEELPAFIKIPSSGEDPDVK